MSLYLLNLVRSASVAWRALAANFLCGAAFFASASCLLAQPAKPELAAASETASTGAAELPAAVIDTDYRIAARDLIQFQIFEEPDLLSVQRVSASGEIGVPMLGTVRVGGLTLREAEQSLAKRYVEGGYFIKPQVILSVQAYAPRSISVLGQVTKPEQIEFPVERESMGIVQAITLAGGFTRLARADSVRVIRSVDGKEEQFSINVSAYLDAKTGAEFRLQPGDIVYVPERAF